ncbi:transmembrane protein DUF3566 [Branchiibius hedensis]|uniref:DUF3566 domain-containing protein n=1 Tax=Branchiibius hedensis TaxID=672460 RepID=A0A2Y9BUJ3_9MICO|nr:transmembrane protein DUF3566 [Branchiibius hedensis]SSA35812.1 Transmembrane protein of unknown function [Branchiibius hedensis]
MPGSAQRSAAPSRPAGAPGRPASPASPAAARGRQPASRSGRPAGVRAGAQARPARATPRRVRLSVSRVDPWSVMKISFLLSVAFAIASVVAVALLWIVLAGMGVFSDLNDLLRSLDKQGSTFDLMDYIGFGKVVSLAVVIGFIDIILITAFATLGAFLYNICASLVGGLRLTLSDD